MDHFVPHDLLDPTLDIVFKLMLLRQQALLTDMLQGVLARPVGEPTILNADILGDHVHDKRVILDLRIALADGSRADLEMQRRTPANLAQRLVYYGARDYAGQLVQGDDYASLTPTAVIAWVGQPLFPKLRRLHGIFELRERHTHLLFSDHFAFHLLQLSQRSRRSALSRTQATAYDAQVERWARFFTARSAGELDRLAAETEIMSLAQHTLVQLSQDPEARRLAREREDAIKLYQDELAVTRAQTEAKVRAEVLLKLLGLRFGRLSAATKTRVTRATREELDLWTERVLTARTLDEVFSRRR